MSYLVLARKWRPTRFDDVVGQRHITHTLQNAIKHERVPHALLFIGSRGIGKTSCARIFAKALNCLSSEHPTPIPCDECASCLSVNQGNPVDVFEIDGASNNGVEQVRELRESTRFSPSLSRFKIYIIDEVHMLSVGAFNALLKTLEEPPSHVKFIFATTEPHKIPDTIISRCQRYDFKRIQPNDIVDALARICEAEGVSAERNALEHVAREAQGGMRDSLSLLDQLISFCGDEVTETKTREILGLTSRELMLGLLTALFRQDADTVLSLLNDHAEGGADLKRLGAELLVLLRDLMVIKVHASPQKILQLPPSELQMMIEAAEPLQVGAIHQTFQTLSKRADELQRSAHPRLILEMALLQMCHQADTGTLNEVMSGLLQLEQHLNQVGLGAGLPPLAPPPSYRPPWVTHRPSHLDHAEVGTASSTSGTSSTHASAQRPSPQEEPPSGFNGAQPSTTAVVPSDEHARQSSGRPTLSLPAETQAQRALPPDPETSPLTSAPSKPQLGRATAPYSEPEPSLPPLREGALPRHPTLPTDPTLPARFGEGVDEQIYQWMITFNRWLAEQDSFFASEMRVKMKIKSFQSRQGQAHLTLGGEERLLQEFSSRQEVVLQQLSRFANEMNIFPESSRLEVHYDLSGEEGAPSIETLSEYIKRQLSIKAARQVQASLTDPYVRRCLDTLGGQVIYVVPEALQNAQHT